MVICREDLAICEDRGTMRTAPLLLREGDECMGRLSMEIVSQLSSRVLQYYGRMTKYCRKCAGAMCNSKLGGKTPGHIGGGGDIGGCYRRVTSEGDDDGLGVRWCSGVVRME